MMKRLQGKMNGMVVEKFKAEVDWEKMKSERLGI